MNCGLYELWALCFDLYFDNGNFCIHQTLKVYLSLLCALLAIGQYRSLPAYARQTLYQQASAFRTRHFPTVQDANGWDWVPQVAPLSSSKARQQGRNLSCNCYLGVLKLRALGRDVIFQPISFRICGLSSVNKWFPIEGDLSKHQVLRILQGSDMREYEHRKFAVVVLALHAKLGNKL